VKTNSYLNVEIKSFNYLVFQESERIIIVLFKNSDVLNVFLLCCITLYDLIGSSKTLHTDYTR